MLFADGMVAAGGVKVAFGGKPRDLIDLVDVLVAGAKGRGGSDNASNSEYIDEQWWSTEEADKGPVDGRRGDDS